MKGLRAIFPIIALLATATFAAEPSTDPMMKMHEHMQNMQQTMKAIREEPDASKRSELMARHMKEMQDGMHMMRGDAPQAASMEQRMEAMQQHMEMMQTMMEQMMEHGKQEAESPARQHEH